MEADCHKCKGFVSSKAFSTIVYIGMVLVTLACVVQNCRDYSDQATYFSFSREAINKDDIPTATICFLSEKPMSYSTDFEIHTFAQNLSLITIVTLKEGMNEYTYSNNKRLLILNQLTVFDTLFYNRSCIKINVIIEDEEIESYNLGGFQITFSEAFKKQRVHQSVLYLTSEMNAYGAVSSKWMEGEVKPLELLRGGFNAFHVTNIKRFDFLDELCSRDTIYQQMSAIFEKSCQENGKTCATSGNAPSQKPFTPYPICKEGKTIEECRKLTSNKIGQLYLVKKKTCSIQEYVADEDKLSSSQDQGYVRKIIKIFETYFKMTNITSNNLLDNQENHFLFHVDLSSPMSTRGKHVNTKEFQKEIHTEKWSITTFYLFGSIGGYMGLFVGFSFTGLIAWTLEIVPKGISAVSRFIDSLRSTSG